MTMTHETPPPTEVLRHALSRPLVKFKLLFLVASFISLVLSVSLWFTGSEAQGIFVGIWVPSILSLGTLLVAGDHGGDR